MLTANEWIEQNIELIDEKDMSYDVKWEHIKNNCPEYLIDEVLEMFDKAGIVFPDNLIKKGITSDATSKEKEFYDYAKSIGYVDDHIFFKSHGVAVCNNDVCINIRDNQDGTAYVYGSDNVKTGYADSRKVEVSYRKVKTILKRGAEGYMIKYMFS